MTARVSTLKCRVARPLAWKTSASLDPIVIVFFLLQKKTHWSAVGPASLIAALCRTPLNSLNFFSTGHLEYKAFSSASWILHCGGPYSNFNGGSPGHHRNEVFAK